MSVPQFSAYLFDVDGTLLDSASDICGAIQSVLATTRQNSVADDFLRRYIGRHLFDLFQDLLPEYTREEMDQMLADYRRIYLARNHSLTRAYPGVANALAGCIPEHAVGVDHHAGFEDQEGDQQERPH